MTLPFRSAAGPLTGERRRRALSMLTTTEAARFASDSHPERFLTGRMLLRELAAELTGHDLGRDPVTAACPDCGREHGQPRIDGIHVSLSHAGERTVAVAHPDRSIGVDVERREVSPERLAAIREIAGGIGLEHWTRVEAVVKADGRGLRIDPRRVEIVGERAMLDGRFYELIDASDSDAEISIALAEE